MLLTINLKLVASMKNFTSALLIIIFIWALPNLSTAQLSYTPNNGIAYHGKAQMSVGAIGAAGSLTITSTGLPSGITINAATGQISWDATVPVGNYTINVFDGTSTVPYTLNVIPNPDDFLTVKYGVSSPTTVFYNSDNGKYHNVDVYLPTGDTNTQRPIFMFMHGGGFQTSGVKTESYVVSFCKYMATCGFVAFAPSYNEGSGHTLPQNLASVKDMDNCLNWIRSSTTASTYKYNPNFLFVGGGSAGAHLSCNFVNFDGGPNYGGYVINLSNVISEADCWGSSPTADRLYSFSNLKSTQIPIMLIQGSSDQTVPVQNSIDLDKALTSVGAYHDFWEVAGATHGIPGHIPAASDTIAHFQNRAWKRQYPQTTNVTVLPIKLVNFKAQQIGNQVSLEWSSASETNTDHFEIESSTDGQKFTSIGIISATGNTQTGKKYGFIVANSIQGITYFRLKCIDKNGFFSYSTIKSLYVQSSNNKQISVYPNPVKAGKDINLNYVSAVTVNATFQIVDALGNTLLSTTQQIGEGTNNLILGSRKLKVGIHFLVVSVNNKIIHRQTLVVE